MASVIDLAMPQAVFRLGTIPSGVTPLPATPPGTALIAVRPLFDYEFGGVGRIYGTVARKNTPSNVPMRRRVRLHRSVDGFLVRETWSNSDGTYEFRELSPRYQYDVIAWDHELSYRSVVANNLTPEV